jgi:hypothetical protein
VGTGQAHTFYVEGNTMKNDVPFIIQIIQDLANVTQLVDNHFKDEQKTQTWLNSDNPLLGGLQPVDMIFQGRTEKLITHIKDQLEGLHP